jgi:uncharacterized protein
MESALYKCLVMHNRLSPKKHRFTYNVFMAWLDIDLLEATGKKLSLFSYNKSNVFSFHDTDHFKYTEGDARNVLNTRQKLNLYLQSKGITQMPGKVFLLTHVRMFGYVFNPVSFYFCYNEQGACTFVVTEISNTFGEMKLFLVDTKNGEHFEQDAQKFFYVSPFTEMDTEFEFRYKIPGEKLNIQINVKDKSGEKFFISTLTGQSKVLNDSRLGWYVMRFPFITLRVMLAIHWQALKLWLKKIPYHKKSANRDLQRDMINVK